MEQMVLNQTLAFLVCFLFVTEAWAQKARIKDLTNLRGVRDNHLVGFGVVVGLTASGDSPASLATNKAVRNLLTRMGMRVGDDYTIPQSVAAVVVTADLPVFKSNGDRIDLKLSTIGDASSLAGGTLLLTPLRAGDGKVYVVGQGSVVVGQANGAGAAVLTAAVVPDGGVVEREFKPDYAPQGQITLSLRRPDFTTSTRVADTINSYFKGFYAQSLDPVQVVVEIPPLYRGRNVEFVADVEGLLVEVDRKATVVLNERTGTIVMGSDVTIGAVTISHGNLAIRVGPPKNNPDAGPQQQSVVSLQGTTVGNLVETINALGVKPADLVGIIQAIHAAGALQAELKFL